MDGPTPSSLMRRRLLAALSLAAMLPSAGAEVLRRPWPAKTAAPPLALPTLDGPPWSLADAKGRVCVVNFWASWCEPCRTELPSLELLAQRHERDGLVVVAVNFRETDAAVRRFVDRMPTTLPLLRDTDGAVNRAWQVRIYPTTFLIGRDGRPRFSIVGEADWNADPVRSWVAAQL